jgi:Reverse transcriptase (RNA-dependent DNA polymerase).
MEDILSFSNTDINIKKQFITLLTEILNQNYFQFDKQYYILHQGITMGSPISGLAAKIYLQHFEDLIMKCWTETGDIIYCNRYVDDTIFDTERTNKNQICTYPNSFHKQLELKPAQEEKKCINRI